MDYWFLVSIPLAGARPALLKPALGCFLNRLNLLAGNRYVRSEKAAISQTASEKLSITGSCMLPSNPDPNQLST